MKLTRTLRCCLGTILVLASVSLCAAQQPQPAAAGTGRAVDVKIDAQTDHQTMAGFGTMWIEFQNRPEYNGQYCLVPPVLGSEGLLRKDCNRHNGAARKETRYDARRGGSAAYSIPIREFEPEAFELAASSLRTRTRKLLTMPDRTRLADKTADKNTNARLGRASK